MVATLWFLSGDLLVDETGAPYFCDDCPCEGAEPCTDTSPNTGTQPDVVVSNSAGGACDGGGEDHDGSYSFNSHTSIAPAGTEGDVWEWFGTTGCDVSPFATSFADITISIECLSGGMWRVGVFTYQVGGFGACQSEGSVDTDQITVNGAGQFVGSVQVTLSDTGCFSLPNFTMDLTFGP